jgi:molybdate transport system substrate-binding protein
MRALAVAGVGVVVVGVLTLVWVWNDARHSHGSSADHRVRVAAAADLKFALDEVITAFERAHRDIHVEATYGSSGNFFAQLCNRAPFDLFLSADIDYPHQLAQQGFARKETEFCYAIGHLVIWVPRRSALAVDKRGAKALLDPSVRKIAIANPRHAPYGRAAEAALKSLGLFDQIKDRLVYGDNVAQTAQFAQTGAADAAMIGLSLARAPSMRDEGSCWEVPLDAYPRLEQGGVILSWAKDLPAAESLRTFLMDTEAKAVLKRYGFYLPGE